MPPQTYSQAPLPAIKLGKFSGSLLIVKQSWALLKQDREILLFPIISSVVSFVVFLIAAALFYFGYLGGDISRIDSLDNASSDYMYYVFLFLYYLVMFFILNFFQAGIYSIAYTRFNGQDMSFSGGIQNAFKNLGKIFIWSLISATVGVVLRIIADKFKIVGQIVFVLFGAAWNILTYFSLPSLVIGGTSIFGSFKDSATIIRKTWGESIIINLGVGFFFGFLIIVGIVIGMVIYFIAPFVSTLIVVGILLLLYIVGLSIVSSALSSIFKLALYEYARTGLIPSGFSPEIIQDAIRAK